MPLPALLFLRTLAAGPRAAAVCGSLECSLAAGLYLRKPGAALELSIDKRKVGAHAGHELQGSTWTAGPPACGRPGGPGVLPGPCPRPCPAHAVPRPRWARQPRPRCVPQSPRPSGPLWAPEVPLGRRFLCRYLALLRTNCQGLCFKNKTNTQALAIQNCMMT